MRIRRFGIITIILLLLLSGCAPEVSESSLSVYEIEFESGITVSVKLPEGSSVSTESSWLEDRIPIVEPHKTLDITVDSEQIGSISLTDFSDHRWVDIDGFMERKEPGALYQGIMTGMNYDWGNYYTVVYEDDSSRVGSATSLVSYSTKNPSALEQIDPDACGQPFLGDGDDPHNYYNRAILGYDINAECWVAIELNYNCITDEQQTEIAESLQIIED